MSRNTAIDTLAYATYVQQVKAGFSLDHVFSVVDIQSIRLYYRMQIPAAHAVDLLKIEF